MEGLSFICQNNFRHFFAETNSDRLSNFLKNHIFESLIIFLERTTKLIIGKFDSKKVTIILLMITQVLFLNIFFGKDVHLNVVDWYHFNSHQVLSVQIQSNCSKH